jgi:hypothetical protein
LHDTGAHDSTITAANAISHGRANRAYANVRPHHRNTDSAADYGQGDFTWMAL